MKKISELICLQNRTAIVTGGAGHIGLAICETLIELGATVWVMDLNQSACDERCSFLNSHGFSGKALPLLADLAKENETVSAIEHVSKNACRLDILIHAAAFIGTTKYPGWAVPFEEQTVDAWDAAIRINMTAPFIMVKASLPYMDRTGKASIIFINSIYGRQGPDNRLYEGTGMVTPAAYSASKGGLGQLTRHFSTILAPDIRVNSITAGGVERGQPDSFRQRYIERTPLKRMATEEDFKGAVAYLASDLSSYVTGSNIDVDGGWTSW